MSHIEGDGHPPQEVVDRAVEKINNMAEILEAQLGEIPTPVLFTTLDKTTGDRLGVKITKNSQTGCLDISKLACYPDISAVSLIDDILKFAPTTSLVCERATFEEIKKEPGSVQWREEGICYSIGRPELGVLDIYVP